MLTPRKTFQAILCMLFVLVAASPQPARAAGTRLVSPGGNDIPGCGTSGYPNCKTIQYALNQSLGCGTLSLAAGTYSSASNGETFPISVPACSTADGATITGQGQTTTFIDASGSGQNVLNVSSGVNLNFAVSGVAVKGGNRGIQLSGGPGYLRVSAQIWDNDIANNVIGVYASSATVQVTHNSISGNTRYGIYYENSSAGQIGRNLLASNCTGGIPSYDAAIYLDNSQPVIENNLIAWNNGSGIYNSQSHPSIINNTIALNYGGSGVAAFNNPLPAPQITNNIIVSNGYLGIHMDGTGNPEITYNDVWANGYGDYLGASAGTGSISKDPRLVSILDFHLLCSSPATNTGINSDSNHPVPTVDYDNNPRPVGGTVDMGAYEKQTDLFCPIYLPLIRK